MNKIHVINLKWIQIRYHRQDYGWFVYLLTNIWFIRFSNTGFMRGKIANGRFN